MTQKVYILSGVVYHDHGQILEIHTDKGEAEVQYKALKDAVLDEKCELYYYDSIKKEEFCIGNTLQTKLVTNFMYFLTNYPSDWIEQIWQGNIAEHFRRKYQYMYDKYGSMSAPFRFFFELEESRKKQLIDWALDYMAKKKETI